MQKTNEQLSKAQDFLSSAKVDGRYPYLFSRVESLSTEATAWSAIALAHSHPHLVEKSIAFLLNSQNDDGGWSTIPGFGESNWSSGPVLLALRLVKHCHPEIVSDKVFNRSLKKAVTYLMSSRMDSMFPVLRLLLLLGKGPPALNFGKGWPWTPHAYSWVEPTAYCLMALKLPNLIDDKLVNIAVPHANQFLLNHTCKGGGWNHGAFYCLGHYCSPYILTTAEALLALIDIKENEKIKESLNYFSNVKHEAFSAWSLAWSILTLDAYGYDCSHNLDLLLSLQNKDGSFGSNFLITALSILALNTTNGINLFKIGADESTNSILSPAH